MKIINLSIDDLKPYEKNAKIHTKKQIEQIKKSIKKFGMNDPIGIWGNNNLIVEGHGRLIACKELGIKDIPCIRLDHLSDKERKAYTLAHNKLTMNTDFDLDLLNLELDEINIDIDMSDFGFDINYKEKENEILEDEIPEIDEKNETITKLGDIWQLGRHRLMCGSCLDNGNVEKLLNGIKCELCFTDPPYQLDTQGGGMFKNANSMKQIKTNGVDEFDPSLLVLHCDTNIYCHNKPLIKKYIELAEQNKVAYDLAFYKKISTIPNYKGHLMTDVEYIALLGKQDPNKGLEKEMYSKCFTGQKDSDNKLSYSKPVALCAKFIKLYAKQNVFEPFCGSGSTLIACEQLNKTCFAMEILPQYCDVILRRFYNLTGIVPKTIEGKEFVINE